MFGSQGFADYEFIASDYELNAHYHFPARMVALDEVVLEKRTGDIIPDIMVRIGTKWLLVEVAVTHFGDAEKKAKIRAMELPAIEIDLSKIPHDTGLSELKELIIRSKEHKQWLNNPELRRVVGQRRRQYFAECRIELERLHAEQLHEEAREQWLASIAGGFEMVKHIDDCPKAANRLSNKPYANVEWDCRNC